MIASMDFLYHILTRVEDAHRCRPADRTSRLVVWRLIKPLLKESTEKAPIMSPLVMSPLGLEYFVTLWLKGLSRTLADYRNCQHSESINL